MTYCNHKFHYSAETNVIDLRSIRKCNRFTRGARTISKWVEGKRINNKDVAVIVRPKRVEIKGTEGFRQSQRNDPLTRPIQLWKKKETLSRLMLIV
jgi:hypothetical protein